jgi:hypothetical protein
MSTTTAFGVTESGSLRLLFIQHLLRWTLIVMAVACVGGLPLVIWFQSTGHQSTGNPPPLTIVLGCMAFGGVVLLVARLMQARLAALVSHNWRVVSRHGGPFVLALMAGLILRLVIGLWVAPSPASDGATYLSLAQQLALEGSYGSSDARAAWPPGLPLVLAPLIMLGIPERWSFLGFGLVAFAIGMFGMRALLARLGLDRGVSLALWAFALWPTYVFISVLPEKELIIIALLPWIAERTLAAMAARSAIAGVKATLTAGALLGLCMLTQPSIQLLPVGLLLMLGLTAPRPLRAAALVVIGIAAMLVVVAPWTARNLHTLGHPVMVSTNSGSVLYRANNNLATGVYTERGTVNLEGMPDEVQRDAEYKRLASEWIAAHPGAFAHLAVAKLLFFMGDDSYGAYAVFSRGNVEIPRPAYLVIKLGTAVVPWMLIWVALGLLAWGWKPSHPESGAGDDVRGVSLSVAAALLTLPVLYLAAIHSVAESGPKYHIVTIPMVCALLAVMMALNAGMRSRDTASH